MAKKYEDVSRRSSLDILADIKARKLDPKLLTPEVRREVVAGLYVEGVSTAETAQLLGCTDRTIRRDLEQIREVNAIESDESFGKMLAGEVMTQMRASLARCRRLAREKNAPHASRVEAERAGFEILDKGVARMQSLGYAPSEAHRVKADLTHHLGGTPSLDALSAEITRLTEIASSPQQLPLPPRSDESKSNDGEPS